MNLRGSGVICFLSEGRGSGWPGRTFVVTLHKLACEGIQFNNACYCKLA
jgi:hypothetical protein